MRRRRGADEVREGEGRGWLMVLLNHSYSSGVSQPADSSALRPSVLLFFSLLTVQDARFFSGRFAGPGVRANCIDVRCER